MSAMNAFSFGAVARERFGKKTTARAFGEPKPETPLEAAWMVLEAANDLGDHATVEICRRVIDANLNGRPASPSDLHVVTRYFR
jgi:hypothetical protein